MTDVVLNGPFVAKTGADLATVLNYLFKNTSSTGSVDEALVNRVAVQEDIVKRIAATTEVEYGLWSI